MTHRRRIIFLVVLFGALIGVLAYARETPRTAGDRMRERADRREDTVCVPDRAPLLEYMHGQEAYTLCPEQTAQNACFCLEDHNADN